MKKSKFFFPPITCITVYILLNAYTPVFQESLSKQLTGQWRNVYVKIKINSAGQSQTMEADSSNWEARLGMKPIRTYFKNDGTYNSEYRNLKDSIIRTVSGTWNISKADTLTMAQLKPTQSTLKLHIGIKNNRATFSGIIDFEGNGKVDDEYYGIQKKFATIK